MVMISTSYLALATSVIVALFVRIRYLAYAFIVASCAIGWFQGYLNYKGIIYIVLLAFVAYMYFQREWSKTLKIVMFIVLLEMLAEFVLHFVPGFEAIMLIDQINISPGSITYTLYFNFDKIIAALLIFSFGPLILDEKSLDGKSLATTIIVYLACVIVILTPALVSGYVKFAPNIPHIIRVWVLNNLLFVSFAEEVIYRGFIQKTLLECMPKKAVYVALGIFITSVIFGLAHYRGGYIYMALAGICGLFYGFAYYKTNRIVSAMLVHFLLNLTHILVFTYPSAGSVVVNL